jgi:hypothetical protein
VANSNVGSSAARYHKQRRSRLVSLRTHRAPTFASGFESSAKVPLTVWRTTQSANELERAAIERWERIVLPGLDLTVRADARVPARLAAQRICEEYLAK